MDFSRFQNFRRVLNVVCFHLGDSPASEFRRRGITQKKAYNIMDFSIQGVAWIVFTIFQVFRGLRERFGTGNMWSENYPYWNGRRYFL